MTGLHDLGERRVVPDRVEVGVLIHLAEIGIVVLDRLLEQAEGSLGKLTTLRLVRLRATAFEARAKARAAS